MMNENNGSFRPLMGFLNFKSDVEKYQAEFDALFPSPYGVS